MGAQGLGLATFNVDNQYGRDALRHLIDLVRNCDNDYSRSNPLVEAPVLDSEEKVKFIKF